MSYNPLHLTRLLAYITATALVAGFLASSPARADDDSEPVDRIASVAQKAALSQNAELAESYPFSSSSDGTLTTSSGISVDGRHVLPHEAFSGISLPVDRDTVAKVASNGSLVFDDSKQGLGIVVEAAGDGAARILSVAEQDYASGSAHKYSYDLDLPHGATLMATDQGAILVLAPPTEDSADENLAPGDALPAPGSETVDPVDEFNIGQGIAGNSEFEGDVEIPENRQLIGGFQTPWSTDAGGRPLPTHFEFEGATLTQVVDTTDAQFPVVSDPLPFVVIGLAAAARLLLPVALRGLSKALATQAIKAGARATTKGGYRSFAAFKKAAGGGTPKTNQWHHIVEQSNLRKRGWNAKWIHNRNNLVSIPKQVHQKCVNSWMAKKNVSKFGIRSGKKTMRQVVHGLSFSRQHAIGHALLRHCGVRI